MLVFNKNILTIGGNRLEGEPLTPPTPPPVFDQVTIGTQIWTSNNLAIDDGGEGIYHAEIISEDNVNFGIQYYYTWDAAVRVANQINGWHLPSRWEWNTLISTVSGQSGSYGWNTAGRKLKSTYGWAENGNGTNEYGFNVLPVGKRTQSGSLYDIGYCTGYWTSTEYDNDTSYSIHLDCDTSQALQILNQTIKQSFTNIRLIKDT